MRPTDRPAPPDPEAVKAKIAEFVALEQADSTEFAEALADNIMAPDAVETAAFRSDELAYASFAAARYLIDHSNEVLKRRRRGSRQQYDTKQFQIKVGRERRMLENIVNGIRARQGLIPNAPNPRRRAMMMLANENLKGDVPRGRFRQLLEEEQEKDRERKRQQKKQRRESRRGPTQQTG